MMEYSDLKNFEIRTSNNSNTDKLKKKIGRNDLCYCGSGKKYKKCCLKKDEKKARTKYLSQQVETVSDEYFTNNEYIKLSGYPVTKFDFFILELLNITGSILYKYNETSSSVSDKIIKQLFDYSKWFYIECTNCKYNCLKEPLKNISFKSLIDKGVEISEFPVKLQKEISINFFYIEFIYGFASKLQQELYNDELDMKIANEISSNVYWSLLHYVSDNCLENCNNECIIGHEENAYCKFCTFGKEKLPCPMTGEISYETIKATEEDMEH